MNLDTTSPVLRSPGDPSISTLPDSFQKHPVRSAWLLFLAYLVLATLAGLAAKALFPQFQPEFIALVAMSIVVAIALSVWHLWHEAGFNPPSAWRDVRLMIFPAIVVLVLPFLGGIQPVEWKSFLYLVVAYALTGFMEEGLMRGIVMRVLKPTGVTRSVVLSALLFALIHVGNLLYRNPFIVLAQMVGAFVHGIGLGAIRLRTNTIWIPVILHGLHDLALKYTRFPAIPLDVLQVTLLMLFGIYLLRTWKPTPETPAL
ncbi:CAAX protease self-immunity [Anaerolinea thermolimosa]|uniref:CPBP family intramembrane glutamic endopeptidase n=1 Tax=Anaerolinea thermolimosa TaxID=229919 RepID=UPI000783160F|nr:CPBP family intramembrane glutamic endopeptidase [Anaerolinea thermolimosa]GAP05353.1 CAAX protease self-immunity [Anaerolinea thermolimosa]